jgi:hypothetical protein
MTNEKTQTDMYEVTMKTTISISAHLISHLLTLQTLFLFLFPPTLIANHLSCHAHASPWRANVSSCEEQTPPTLEGTSRRESEGNLGNLYEEPLYSKPELGVLSCSTAAMEQCVASRPTHRMQQHTDFAHLS